MKTSGLPAWRASAELILLCAALGSLSLSGSRAGRPHSLESNAVNVSLAKSRQTRSVGVMLMPVNCEMSSWSSWTTCDPCQKKRYRHAYLLQPSQFYGEPCNFSDKEVEDCVTSRPCRSQVRCEGFVCAQTGRCVNRRLLCNGDNDCGDQSDEANCRRIYKKCQHEMDQYWAIGRLASGINLFTNSFEGPVLDHRYYAGGCSPHYILNTRFRKPYNVDSYTPQTQGKYEFALTEYESYLDFEHNITETRASLSSFGFGFKIPGIVELGFNRASGNSKHFISRTKRFSHTKSTFLHARSDLEVAHYKLKPRSLMLHYEFLQRVKLLPLEYSYGEYRDLFRDFGTHYITEAVLGGVYEYTLIMNKEAMERADYSLKDVQACAQNGFRFGIGIEVVYVKLGVSVDICRGILNEIGDRNKRNTMVDDLVVLVRGGASEHITTLAYKELPTADLMQEWGDAVQYNPDIIKIKNHAVNASVLLDSREQPARSPMRKMSPLMGGGVAGQTGLRVLEDIKQDKGSAKIHLLKMEAVPAWALLQKHLTVKEEVLLVDNCCGLHTARALSPEELRPSYHIPAPTWGQPENRGLCHSGCLK
ncbi:complement component C8 beta chain isoform X2 [Zalophus californianus]|uniref:Complement component C8 beta chain n=1 Tax=Zalophus californianus TaxID=9704 RepID=A0A6J2C038_ZALCA|nr:complement component C8 beta chain isoform X2 [Zalophus californianus]